MRGSWLAILMLAGPACLGGCSTYSMRGVAVMGRAPALVLVDPDDPRLIQNGVQDVVVDIVIDPNAMRPKRIPQALSDSQGRFEAPIPVDGIGVLQYECQVVARREGCQTVQYIGPVPPRGKRVLLVMAEGRDTYRAPENLIEDTLRQGKQFDR